MKQSNGAIDFIYVFFEGRLYNIDSEKTRTRVHTMDVLLTVRVCAAPTDGCGGGGGGGGG